MSLTVVGRRLTPAPRRGRRRGPWRLGLLLLVVSALFGAVLAWAVGVGRGGGPTVCGCGEQVVPGPGPLPRSSVGDVLSVVTDLHTSEVGRLRVPTSSAAGPFRVEDDGTAAGYARTLPGAVLAAVGVTERVSDWAGPTVVQTTVAVETLGTAPQRAALEANGDVPGGAGTVASGVLRTSAYRVDSVDSATRPTDVHLQLVSVAGDGPPLATAVELRFSRGDWRLVLPLGRSVGYPRPVPAGFFPLRS